MYICIYCELSRRESESAKTKQHRSSIHITHFSFFIALAFSVYLPIHRVCTKYTYEILGSLKNVESFSAKNLLYCRFCRINRIFFAYCCSFSLALGPSRRINICTSRNEQWRQRRRRAVPMSRQWGNNMGYAHEKQKKKQQIQCRSESRANESKKKWKLNAEYVVTGSTLLDYVKVENDFPIDVLCSEYGWFFFQIDMDFAAMPPPNMWIACV